MKILGKMLKILLGLIIGVCILLPLVSLPFDGFLYAHEKSFAKQLSEYQLPADTALIESHAYSGHLAGNGNYHGCLAAILVKSELSEEQLAEHYGRADFDTLFSPNSRRTGHQVQLEVKPAEGEVFTSSFMDGTRHDLDYEALDDLTDFSGYYYVTICDGGYNLFTDFPICAVLYFPSSLIWL